VRGATMSHLRLVRAPPDTSCAGWATFGRAGVGGGWAHKQ
jgi:hypothetical protein